MVAAAQRIEHLDRLERMIETQSLLVQADLALNPFMQLVIDKLRELTQAQGASVDFVEGSTRSCDAPAARWRATWACASRATPASRACACARAGQHCADSESDERVDRATCRLLGVRSMIFAPLRRANVAVGVLKVFSSSRRRSTMATCRCCS